MKRENVPVEWNPAFNDPAINLMDIFLLLNLTWLYSQSTLSLAQDKKVWHLAKVVHCYLQRNAYFTFTSRLFFYFFLLKSDNNCLISTNREYRNKQIMKTIMMLIRLLCVVLNFLSAYALKSNNVYLKHHTLLWVRFGCSYPSLPTRAIYMNIKINKFFFSFSEILLMKCAMAKR